MDISDILFSSEVELDLKQAVLQACHEHNLSSFTPVLIPTAANNDVNGSQHALPTVDFTYREADGEDLRSVATLGYYEYFSTLGTVFTGHYYEGDGRHFDALVLNPPTYAVEWTV